MATRGRPARAARLRKGGDAGAIVAAIRVTGGEIEPRLGPQRLLYAAKFGFKIARRGEIIRWKRDEDEAVGVGGDIVEMERAFPLLGAALAEREQPAEPAVSGAVRRIGEQARRIVEIEARSRQ